MNVDTPFYTLPLLCFDTETTGVDVWEDRVVTCNITYLAPDGTITSKSDWLINPGVPIPEGATAVHGVTDAIAAEHGIPPEKGLQLIADHFNAWDSYKLPMVAYNASYDISLLRAEFLRYGINCTAKWDRVVDPYVLDKQLWKYRKGSRKLTSTAELYGIVLDNAHAADADSMAAGLLARAIGKKYKIDGPVTNVHNRQIEFKAEQSASLQEYFRRTKDPKIVINGEWPYQTTREGS